jgi:hypothetical protein
MRPEHLLLLLRGDPTAITTYANHLFVGGFVLTGLSLLMGGNGILTGFFLAGIGGAGLFLAEWRSDRGLWMLAGLFLIINLFVYGCFCVGQIRDAIHGVQIEGLALLIDVTLATGLLIATIRFLTRVAVENFASSRRAQD